MSEIKGPTQAELLQRLAPSSEKQEAVVSSSGRFESGSLTEARWPAPLEVDSKPTVSSQLPHHDIDPALVGIAEEVKESGGHWQPCTGCYDTEDGHPTQKYDYSPALQTSIGGGCHECGGLGAVWWHMTDSDIADFAKICAEDDTEHQLTMRIVRLEFALRYLSKAYAACNGEDHPAYEDAQRTLANTLPKTSIATNLVIVESPFAGDVEANVAYARAALRDCLNRGEAPYASHLLYTQPGVLDDTNADQRRTGIEAGLAWGRLASATVVYTDRGISTGMQQGIDRATEEGRIVEYRSIEKAARQTNDGPTYLDFITPDEVFDKGPAAVEEWQKAKRAEQKNYCLLPRDNSSRVEELRKGVMRAIFDPGATEGYKGERDLTTWQTDAVMRALAATKGFAR